MQVHDEQRIKQSCMDFVAFKDALDATGRNLRFASPLERAARALSCLTPSGEGWTAIHPGEFCLAALSFADAASRATGEMTPEDVDPRLIIAGTWNKYSPTGWAEGIDPVEVMNDSDAMAKEETAHHSFTPQLAKIGNLPLYVAIEGKNRVTLFKQFRRTMRAMVIQTHFPAPQDLELVRLWPFGVHALKYGESIEILPFPAYTLPILEAYGVPKGKGKLDLGAAAAFLMQRKRICSQQMG